MTLQHRIFAFSSLVAFSATTWLACNGDDALTAAADAGRDATSDVTVKPADAGADGANSADAADAAAPGVRVALLNNLVTVQSPIRFCFAANTSGAPGLKDMLADLPVPGPAGLGAGEVGAATLPAAIQGKQARVYVYYTSSLNAFALSGKSCAELAAASVLVPADGGAGDGGLSFDGGVALIEGLDFDVSEPIDAKVLSSANKYVLLATGCPKSSDPGKANPYCGDPVVLGDFHVYAAQLDSKPPAAGKSRLQPLFAITAVDYLGIPPFEMGALYGDPNDGGVSAPLSGPDGGFPVFKGNIALPAASDVPSLKGASALYDKIDVQLDLYPIPDTLSLSGLTPNTSLEDTFTFVTLGNPFGAEEPTLGDGGLNPRYLGARLIPNK